LSIEAAKQIVSQLDSRIAEGALGDPYFKDPEVETFPFSRESFHGISQTSSERRLAFVDGGNLEILGAPNFSIQLNRVYSCVWNKTKKEIQARIPAIEFFSATYSKCNDDEISYEAFVVPAKPSDSIFLPDSKDLSVKAFEGNSTNGNPSSVQALGSMARNFAEWRYATVLSEYMKEGDVIVMDGSLQTGFRNEWNYFRKLEEATQKKGVMLTSLSKTSWLFTTTGLSLLGAMNQFANDNKISGEWYHPIFDSRKHHVYGLIVKLKSFTDWVFRLDIQRDQFLKLDEGQLNEILSLLAQNSSDPTFPGYPYGSIDADLFSRVSENELDYYRALIMSQISAMNKLEKFRCHVRAGDAHEILNMIAS
jgi:hypothetical protein